MIGRVTFLDGDEPAVLVLGDDLLWRGPEPYASSLDVAIEGEDTSPARGTRYHRHVLEVAETLRGTAEFPPRKPGPAGRIY